MKLNLILLSIFMFAFCRFALAQDKIFNIECELTINETEWVKESQLTAKLTLRNNYDKEVKIYLPPRFELETQGVKIDSSQNLRGLRYGSNEKQQDHIITKKTKMGYSFRIRQQFNFTLKSGESKTLEFNLSNLAWKDRMSSILLDESWYQIVPNGKYDLFYHWSYKLDEDNKQMVNILSNKVEVRLNSEK